MSVHFQKYIAYRKALGFLARAGGSAVAPPAPLSEKETRAFARELHTVNVGKAQAALQLTCPALASCAVPQLTLKIIMQPFLQIYSSLLQRLQLTQLPAAGKLAWQADLCAACSLLSHSSPIATSMLNLVTLCAVQCWQSLYIPLQTLETRQALLACISDLCSVSAFSVTISCVGTAMCHMHSHEYLLLCVQTPVVNNYISFCAHLQYLRQRISALVMLHAALKHVIWI